MPCCARQAHLGGFAMSGLQIGLLVFPKVTQLDLTGPVQVFSSVPGAQLHLIWKRIEPVASDSVLVLTPTTTFADCPQLDVICVPGGVGSDDLLNDEEVLDFLRRQAEGAKFVTSVCTGSLVLGAAGLPQGTGPRWIVSQPSARRRPRRGSVSTATASPAAASPRASISR